MRKRKNERTGDNKIPKVANRTTDPFIDFCLFFLRRQLFLRVRPCIVIIFILFFKRIKTYICKCFGRCNSVGQFMLCHYSINIYYCDKFIFLRLAIFVPSLFFPILFWSVNEIGLSLIVYVVSLVNCKIRKRSKTNAKMARKQTIPSRNMWQ